MKKCCKCKKERHDNEYEVNPRTGKPNCSCFYCLDQTRSYQKKYSEWQRLERIASRGRKATDGVPWPASQDKPTEIIYGR